MAFGVAWDGGGCANCGRCGGVVSPNEGHAPPRPLLTTDLGKGLAGFRPHAAPLRMRARSVLHSPGDSRQLAASVFTGLDHLFFYPEGT